jgi:hypothetical protein
LVDAWPDLNSNATSSFDLKIAMLIKIGQSKVTYRSQLEKNASQSGKISFG